MIFSSLASLAPVVVVADERQLLAGCPRLELERPGARRMLRRVGAARLEDPVLVDRARVRLVVLQRLRADDVQARERQGREDRRRRLRQVERHRQVVDGLATLVEALVGARGSLGRRLEAAAEAVLPVVGRAVALERGGEVEPALEVEADGGGVERLAVVERDAVTERERPGQPVVARFPALRERGLHLGRPRLQPGQAFRHLVQDADRFPVRDQGAVERRRVRRAAEDEGVSPAVAPAAPGGGRCQRAYDDQRSKP